MKTASEIAKFLADEQARLTQDLGAAQKEKNLPKQVDIQGQMIALLRVTNFVLGP